MPKLTLGDVVEVVSKAGSPKANKVSEIKNRPPYSPATDFYKPLREGIIAIHEQGEDKRELKSILARLSDQKKLSHYPRAIKGYEKWWGRKQIEWHAPYAVTYQVGDIDISVKPELGLMVDGVPHFVKLYLKDEKLQKLRVDVVLALMEHSLRPDAPDGCCMAILDVKNSKLFTGPGHADPKLLSMINAEMAYVSAYWGQL